MTQVVVAVVHSGKIAENSKALENVLAVVDELTRAEPLPQMCRRPRLTSRFAGREEELELLKQVLDSYGSSAIMQYGRGVCRKSGEEQLDTPQVHFGFQQVVLKISSSNTSPISPNH